jgi:HEAT repeat protein
MNRWAPRTAACAAGAAGLVLALAAFAGRDRLVEEWHLRRLESRDFGVRFHAARRLGEMRSTRAVPGLIALLRDLEGHDREARAEWGHGARAGASVIAVLGAIGPPAVPALELALEESQDEREQWRRLACRALARIRDPSAVDALAGLLGDGHPCSRLEAIRALATLEPEAQAALPALTAATGDRHWVVRQCAGGALARIRGSERGAGR